jgi:hypothetical protein
MKIKNFLVGFLAAVLLVGCSGKSGGDATASSSPSPAAEAPAGFVVKVSDAAIPFELKTARVDVRPDVTEAQFSLANYDFEMNHMEANSVERSKEDGQVRIAFALKGEKGEGDNFKNPVMPGEYGADKLIWMDIYQGKGGTDTMTTNIENKQGSVVIKTVTDTELTGTIDVQGDNGFEVKGDFSAVRVPAQ